MKTPSDPLITLPVTRTLMFWFEQNRRAMPWRGDTDPYRIWISEIMLQQTQVRTVEAYYLRWMERFPTVEAFAAGSLDDALKLWEGLGYYSRVRNAHRGARMIVERFSGRFPQTPEGLQTIPGIGEYISAAVASIAFGHPSGVVDGNVIRVMSRLFGLDDLATRPAFRRRIRGIVESGFYDHHPGWVNQAWMEFGALQCIPRPSCAACPFRYLCVAHAMDRVARFPRKPPRMKVPIRRGSILIVRDTDRILMVRRRASGLLGGLWELPNVMQDEETIEEFLARTGLRIFRKSIHTVRHAYSHFKVLFELHEASSGDTFRLDDWETHVWADRWKLGEIAIAKVHIDALKKLGMLPAQQRGSG